MNAINSPSRGTGYLGAQHGPYVHFMRQRAAIAARHHQHPVPVHRQWPWRALAFSSDFGILAHMIDKPKWGMFGWLVAVPYYLYGLAIQPNAEARKEEAIYQATANGILPFLHIKLGTVLGSKLGQKLSPRLAWPFKLLGGVAALAALTPTVGDPIGEHLIETFRDRPGKPQPALKPQPVPTPPGPAESSQIGMPPAAPKAPVHSGLA